MIEDVYETKENTYNLHTKQKEEGNLKDKLNIRAN